MIRRPPRSTLSSSSAASDVYKRQALVQLLTSAQADHRKCIEGAAQAKEDPVDKCALTWGNVVLRYRQFGAYRAPFESEAAADSYSKFWTKKRIDKHEKDTA
eukprot:TRINITY_DN23366_c0_g1_i6.p2 TRINITY_DN23366_c0_g1~~TRINITY_DN23366_c0_g1_i6.p2  ORF type:complete len:102 (-),score=46.13 TRINITY_DN23366_c0_g1_i6:324-629(-)